MPTWRSLDDYSPFARVLVTYMWEQRPPLLPSGFAVSMGVRKQQVSSWLITAVVPDPPLVVRLARQMGMSVRDLLIASGHATADDPLFDVAGAWAYVRQQLAAALRDRELSHEVAISTGVGNADDQERDEPEGAASSTVRVELLVETLETIEALERRQRVADRQRPLAPPPPPDASIPVAAEHAAPDDDGGDASYAADDAADDMEGASRATDADHAATPSASVVPATRVRKGV